MQAEHAYAPAMLSGGRFATVRNIDEHGHGELWIDDPEAEEQARLDQAVFRYHLGPRWWSEPGWPYAPSDGDVVVWSVHDGERSGLWAARVP